MTQTSPFETLSAMLVTATLPGWIWGIGQLAFVRQRCQANKMNYSTSAHQSTPNTSKTAKKINNLEDLTEPDE